MFPVSRAEKERGVEFSRVFIGRVAVLDRRLSAVIIPIAVDVYHARHRVGAVGGRRAILQDFNALDRRLRNRVQIDEDDAPVARRIRRNAAAIEEDERRARVEAAQRDRGRAHRRIRTILVIGNGDAVRIRDRKIAQNSSVVRSPVLLIRSRVTLMTGFGPTSFAVGIAEPVTKTRSAVATSVLGSAVPWALTGAGTCASWTASGANAWAKAGDAVMKSTLTPIARALRKNSNFVDRVLDIRFSLGGWLGLAAGLTKTKRPFKTFFEFF